LITGLPPSLGSATSQRFDPMIQNADDRSMRQRFAPLILAGMAACGNAVAAPPSRPLPIVEVTTLESRSADLRTFINGRAALINVWASWCEACETELPALNRLADHLDPSTAVVIGIAAGEARHTVTEFLERHPLRYPQLVDEDFRVVDTLGMRRVPTTLVIDRHGWVVFSGGALDGRALSAFRRASGERPDAPIGRE